MISEKPDFRKATEAANEILIASHDITGFPFKVKRIIETMTDIKVCSFQQAEQLGLDIKSFGSDSAVLISHGGRYIMFFNQEETIERIKFSMLHELGHYWLNHSLEITSENVYGRMEVEANMFAAQILMPDPILRELMARGVRITKRFLMETFKVSSEAAQKRLDTLSIKYAGGIRKQDDNLDQTIIFKFSSFIEQISPKCDVWDWDELERQRERDEWKVGSCYRYGKCNY